MTIMLSFIAADSAQQEDLQNIQAEQYQLQNEINSFT